MYKKAIDYLMNEEIDFREVCIQVAKSNPSVFSKACDAVMKAPIAMCAESHKGLNLSYDRFAPMYEKWGAEVWFDETMAFLFGNKDGAEKIRAIKAHRAGSGYGLKESKEFVEMLMEGSGENWTQNW